MRSLLFLTMFVFSILNAATAEHLSKKYASSKKCEACHMDIVKHWRDSWHAKSHYDHDEYLRKSIDFAAKKLRLSKDIVKVKCAKCHNPRISVEKISDDEAIVESLGFKTKISQATQDKTIKEGINCLVCHNVDKIHYNAPQNVRGMDRVEWNKNGIMSGPFKDAKSPYHKTQYRDFFGPKQNQLCFVCHANDHSLANEKLVFTNLQNEYKGGQKCSQCHMGPKKPGFAATYPIENKKPKKRLVRTHRFAGAHKTEMWKGALKLSVKTKQNDILITLTNPQPHNIPTGFGGRELLIEVTFYKAGNTIDTKTISLTQHYKRKRGRKSTPHLALEATKNMSVPAKGKKLLKLKTVPNADEIQVKLYYRLVNEEIRTLLDLKEKIWQKKFFIDSQTLML